MNKKSIFITVYILLLAITYLYFKTPILIVILLVPLLFISLSIKKALIVLSIPVLLVIYWLHPVISKTFVWWYTKDDNNQYHEIVLGENQTISIDVENHLPFKWTYVVDLRLELIDGVSKIKTDIANRSYKAGNALDNAIGVRGETRYPIRLQVNGYKITHQGEKKTLFYSDFLSNDKGFNASWAEATNKNNKAVQTDLSFIEDMEKGSYFFEIKDLSERLNYFNEIKAFVSISPHIRIQ